MLNPFLDLEIAELIVATVVLGLIGVAAAIYCSVCNNVTEEKE